jgi:HPt (histidine-containing phosphotransfer) domain-containing protein
MGTGGDGKALSAEVLQGLLDADDGRGDILTEVIDEFLRSAPAVLSRLENAIGRDDRKQVAFEAHGLEGSSAMVGAIAMSERCGEITRLARGAGRRTDLEAAYLALQREYRLASGDLLREKKRRPA